MEPNLIKAAEHVVLEPNLHGAIWIFIISLLGEAAIQIPSSILFAGQLLLVSGPFSIMFMSKLFLFVILPISVGTTLGSYVSYGLAYYGGKPAIEKFKKYLRFSWEDVEKFEKRFSDKWYDEILFFVLRALPLTPTLPLNIGAGILRMRMLRYTVLTLAGITLRLIILFTIFGLGSGSVLIKVLDL